MNNVKIAMITFCPVTGGGGTNKQVHKLAHLFGFNMFREYNKSICDQEDRTVLLTVWRL